MYQSSKNYKLYKNWKTKSTKRYSTTLCYWNSTSTCIKDSVWYIHQWSVKKQTAVLAHSFTSLWFTKWLHIKDESEGWSSQKIFQFKQLEGRSLKNIRPSTGIKPVTSTILVRCSANWAGKPHIGSEVNLLSSLGARPICWVHIFPCSEMMWNILYLQPQYKYGFHTYSHLFTAREDMNVCGGHGFESHWSPDIFQASSFQLLKLENLRLWSLFTFIYNPSTN